MDRPYASLFDIVDDLEIDGVRSVTQLMRDIFAASNLIDKRGHFVPIVETRKMDGSGKETQWVDPLLTVTSITLDGTVLSASDYVLKPQNRMWEHGPYTSIELTDLGIWTNTEHNQVEIQGKWGLYDDTLALAATASQTNTATTLV